MKQSLRIYTLFLCLLSFSFTSYSQQLDNTTWQIFNPINGSSLAFFQFASDTVYSSPNNTIYNPSSTYTENGSNFNIVDLSLNPCQGDTGRYSFNISTDTLNFTAVQDFCANRLSFFNNVIWVKLITTGLLPETSQEVLKPVYPNPAVDFITIPSVKKEALFYILDQTGKVVFNGELKSTEQNIDLSHLPAGIYYLRSKGEQIKAQKISKL